MQKESPPTLRIVVTEESATKGLNTSYYKQWLEEQSGYHIEFDILSSHYSTEYLEASVQNGTIEGDIYFSLSGWEGTFFTEERILDYGRKGVFLPLESYLDNSTYFNRILTEQATDDLRQQITSADEHIYYMPRLDISANVPVGQVLRLNSGWLNKLQLSMPHTTEELYNVLTAFKTKDPNGNGLADEIPLIGSERPWSQQSYQFIINSFVYNDPQNMYLFVKDGKVYFAPSSNEWRQAMQFLRRLYQEELLYPSSSTLAPEGLTELANSPLDLIGGFTSTQITDVIYSSCVEGVERFSYTTPPLEGPQGASFAIHNIPVPSVGGIISAQSDHPEEAFALLDLMVSPQAFLAAEYGQEGVDWVYAEPTDRISSGEQAIIRVFHHKKDALNIGASAGGGPLYAYPQYISHVAWDDFATQSIDARAYQTYSKYIPDEQMGMFTLPKNTLYNPAVRKTLEEYIECSVESFMSGLQDPSSDEDWTAHLTQLEKLHIHELMETAQRCYDSRRE